MAKERNEFMTSTQRADLGALPRTHRNCLDKTGVARPGKTAQDRSRKERVTKPVVTKKKSK